MELQSAFPRMQVVIFIGMVILVTKSLQISANDVCDTPKDPENGKVECDEGPLYPGKKCVFSCFKGHWLLGSSLRQCNLDSKSWSGRAPVCVTELEYANSFKEYFCCLDSSECVPQRYFCDNGNDCKDKSDEKYCDIDAQTVSCPVEDSQWLMCADKKRCYPKSLRCSGFRNCRDGSDEIDCEFEPRNVSQAIEAEKNLTDIIQKQYDVATSSIRWEKHSTRISTRTVMAFFLSTKRDKLYYTETKKLFQSDVLMQLIPKLALKKKITTYELSHFINALLVTCINPRDFFGLNLVSELRERVNNSNYTNPFTILTLCNARDLMTMEDVVKIKNVFEAKHRPLWTDTQAVATMALSCISLHSRLEIDDRILQDMVRELKRKQFRNGTIETLRTTALVVQALMAADSYKTEFNIRSAVSYMVDKVKSKEVNLEDAYYILPVLNHLSLMDISSYHCKDFTKTDMEMMKELRDFPDDHIQVQFSVYIGNENYFIRTWKLKVPANYTFYQVFEVVSSLELGYNVQYGVSDGKPYVTGVGNFTDDAEYGKFWFIYTQTLSSQRNLTLIKKSPVDIKVTATEEIILWYKSGSWDSLYGTYD